jgi:hypothetical protein
MEGPTSKKTNEQPKRVTTRGTSSFRTSPLVREKHINKERRGPFARTLSLDGPSPTAIACFKISLVVVVTSNFDIESEKNPRTIS